MKKTEAREEDDNTMLRSWKKSRGEDAVKKNGEEWEEKDDLLLTFDLRFICERDDRLFHVKQLGRSAAELEEFWKKILKSSLEFTFVDCKPLLESGGCEKWNGDEDAPEDPRKPEPEFTEKKCPAAWWKRMLSLG